MRALIAVLLIVYGVIVVALIAFISVTYNQLVRLKNKVKNSYAQIETQMQRIDDLEETEERIAYSRQFYNDAVTIYNNKLQAFPSNIVARIFGFKEEVLLDTE